MNNLPKIRFQTQFSDILSISYEPEDLFTLLYLLHESNSSKTFKAIHNVTREIYAIKIISIIDNDPIKIFQKFHSEILLLNAVYNSEFITKYYGSYISHKSNSIWLIFEYCCAGSCYDLMISMGKSFNEKEISVIISNILHAIIFLHQINIIHKNIKCSNILLKKEGSVKLSDFKESVQILNKDIIKDNNILKIETKNDIFLLGITCIELFKGPISEESRFNLIERLKGNLFTFDDLYSENDFSKEFFDFLRKCIDLDKKPSAYKLMLHPFITKYNTMQNRENLTKIILKYYEEIENRKKETGSTDICEYNYIDDKNINTNIIENNKNINSIENDTNIVNNFIIPQNLQTNVNDNTIFDQNQQNYSSSEKILNAENINDENKIDKNISNIISTSDLAIPMANNIIINNEDNIDNGSEDKLAEFRLEQMVNGTEQDFDKYSHSEDLFEDKEINNKGDKKTIENYHFESQKNVTSAQNKKGNKFLILPNPQLYINSEKNIANNFRQLNKNKIAEKKNNSNEIKIEETNIIKEENTTQNDNFEEEFKTNLEHLNKYDNILKNQCDINDNSISKYTYDNSKFIRLFNKVSAERANNNNYNANINPISPIPANYNDNNNNNSISIIDSMNENINDNSYENINENFNKNNNEINNENYNGNNTRNYINGYNNEKNNENIEINIPNEKHDESINNNSSLNKYNILNMTKNPFLTYNDFEKLSNFTSNTEYNIKNKQPIVKDKENTFDLYTFKKKYTSPYSTQINLPRRYKTLKIGKNKTKLIFNEKNIKSNSNNINDKKISYNYYKESISSTNKNLLTNNKIEISSKKLSTSPSIFDSLKNNITFRQQQDSTPISLCNINKTASSFCRKKCRSIEENNHFFLCNNSLINHSFNDTMSKSTKNKNLFFTDITKYMSKLDKRKLTYIKPNIRFIKSLSLTKDQKANLSFEIKIRNSIVYTPKKKKFNKFNGFKEINNDYDSNLSLNKFAKPNYSSTIIFKNIDNNISKKQRKYKFVIPKKFKPNSFDDKYLSKDILLKKPLNKKQEVIKAKIVKCKNKKCGNYKKKNLFLDKNCYLNKNKLIKKIKPNTMRSDKENEVKNKQKNRIKDKIILEMDEIKKTCMKSGDKILNINKNILNSYSVISSKESEIIKINPTGNISNKNKKYFH